MEMTTNALVFSFFVVDNLASLAYAHGFSFFISILDKLES